MKSHLVDEQAKVLRANRAQKRFEKQLRLEQGQGSKEVDKELKVKYHGKLVIIEIIRSSTNKLYNIIEITEYIQLE